MVPPGTVTSAWREVDDPHGYQGGVGDEAAKTSAAPWDLMADDASEWQAADEVVCSSTLTAADLFSWGSSRGSS